MLAGSLDLEEPWYITGAEFNPVKNVIDVYVGIRENADIACPHCGGPTKRYGYDIVRNVTLANNKRCGLHHFTADLFKRSCAQMRHIDNIDRQQLCTQLLKAGQEHPSMLRNHSLIAILLYQLFATLHTARTDVQ